MGVGDKERVTQNRIVKLFTDKDKMGYRYLGNWEERGGSNVEDDLLAKWLSEEQGYSGRLVKSALFELNRIAGDETKSLYDTNKEIYSMLRYGIKLREDIDEHKETVWLIDWENPDRNDFAIAEEVTVQGLNTKRPDIVLYVNGIALGVIELKRSTVSLSEGIRQNLDNQSSTFVQSFYNTMQLVMAGNDTEGLRYGTIETPEKHYLKWKEADRHTYSQMLDWRMVGHYDKEALLLDKHLLQLCDKKRMLEIIHDFTVFDRGIKKLCRHNQYFGIKAAQIAIQERQGGVIWHSQGSGKSLTMVWLAKWILQELSDARVLIITDRDELDKQIEKVFTGVEEQIIRTKSGSDLISQLNTDSPRLLCSLIHKFGRKDQPDYEDFIEEIKHALPKDFKAKGDIYVFVDECHRTQSGKLHEAMKTILPEALLIGFTGTPLLKKDKLKSIETFGPYLHTYKFDEAVNDEVILDLQYEARKIDQDISSQSKIDRWFEAKTRGLTDFAVTELKKRWGTLQKVLSSKERLSKIVADVMLDLETKERLQNGRGNAMLVAGSIYEACKYYEMFQDAGLKKCAIVTSYDPRVSDIKGETVLDESATEKKYKYDVYTEMLNGKKTEDFEEETKKKFVDEPAQMKLLIVVDKLLTGFDAPSATYLYIDKRMQDHGLFQAICRVNRLDGEDKEYGYIVDYKDLFGAIEKSVDDYTSEVFDDFDKEDVQGLLTNRLETAKGRLIEAQEAIRALCEPVQPPKEISNYIQFFCGNTEKKEDLLETEQSRHTLYKLTAKLVRAYANLANELFEAGFTVDQQKALLREVRHYEDVRKSIKLASGDYIDLKQFEPSMRHLIDTYIGATESEKMADFEDLTIIDLIVNRGGKETVKKLPTSIRKNKEAVAETIENNVRKTIIDKMPTNPKYFEKMSVLLDSLIKERKEEVEHYEAYLKKMEELARSVTEPSRTSSYPSSVNSPAKRALYDNLAEDEEASLAMDAEIKYRRQDGWRGHFMKEKQIRKAIEDTIPEGYDVETIFDIVKQQNEY